VSGSTKARAAIDDLDAAEWHGTIAEIGHVYPRSALHTIRIGEGERTGAFAVVEIDCDEGRQGAGTLSGRTPFEADPRPI
jgi:hypothetical protein